MRILITGGSGLVGKHLTRLLQHEGHEVAWLTRSASSQGSPRKFEWNIEQQTMDVNALVWADAIVHLAGAGVADKRWSDARKREILESRVQSTRLLYEHLKVTQHSVKQFISASAIGYYGFKTSDAWFDEQTPVGNDFLAEVTQKWEEEVEQFTHLGVNTSFVRIGIVLAKEGGALKEMLKPPVISALGSGEQWIPWIHIQDLCRIFSHTLKENLSGVYNAVAPNPVNNLELSKALAKNYSKLFLPIPLPGFVLKLAVGEMAGMLLNGTRVKCDKIINTGFKFVYEELEDALKSLK